MIYAIIKLSTKSRRDAHHFSNGKLYIAHIGDSRIYRVRRDCMEKLTEDHTEAHSMEKAGLLSPGKAENHRLSHVLTKALGSSRSAGRT